MKWRTKSKLARAGKILGDRYRLEALLGRGAMGEIWRAEHLRLKSQVAIKFLDSAIADDPEMLNRFLREAQSAAAVRSPHVVQIFDCGVERGTPYISMELLQGQTLEARLNERLCLTPAELDEIFRQVALAVDKAHEVGVVHRDLKPGNIFLALEAGVEITKVLDFGIAKVVSHTTHAPGLTATGTLLGTPHYMSPEQARGTRAVDFRSDLWSLAIIAFECLTGQQPFPGLALGELVVQICTEKPRVPSSLAPVPAGFDEWFEKGTSKDPKDRFASAREMADSLSALLRSSAAQEVASRAQAGTPGAPDTLHSVTIPVGRPALGESWSARTPSANAAGLRGSREQLHVQQHGVPALRRTLAAQLMSWISRARGTVDERRRRPRGESPPGEAASPLAWLRHGPRWLLPASLLFGATLVLGATRFFWFGGSPPVPLLAGERTAVAAPPARAEQWQAPLAPAPAAPAGALPAKHSPEPEAALPARGAPAPVVARLAPALPEAGLEQAAPGAPPAQRLRKPAAPSRSTSAKAAPKARPPAAPAAVADRAPSAVAPAPAPSSKNSAVDPFSERL